jgi:hypothetical protein
MENIIGIHKSAGKVRTSLSNSQSDILGGKLFYEAR